MYKALYIFFLYQSVCSHYNVYFEEILFRCRLVVMLSFDCAAQLYVSQVVNDAI